MTIYMMNWVVRKRGPQSWEVKFVLQGAHEPQRRGERFMHLTAHFFHTFLSSSFVDFAVAFSFPHFSKTQIYIFNFVLNTSISNYID